MSRNISTEEMDDVIAYLMGTCKSLDEGIVDVLEDEDVQYMSDIDNEMEFCARVDEAMFLCSRCGWWCEAGDWISEDNPNYNPDEETCTQCGNE